jgi:AcrR family transcriptional regulator
MQRTRGDTFTVQDVAAEAGQSLRSFYQHFGSKDELFVAVFEETMRVYASLLQDAVDKFEDPLDRLIAGTASVARLTRKSSEGLVVVMTRLRMRLTESNPEKLAESTGQVTGILRQLVIDALAAGVVHDCDPDTVAFSLFALGSNVALSHFLGNTFALTLPNDTQFVRFCLRGLNADLREDWTKRHGLKD